MISAREAVGLILQNVRALESEEVPLSDSLHRYLARPVTAPISLPPFDNSAMDGFALQSEETRSASQVNPAAFKVIGTIAAGDGPGKIGPGEACRIMTGAAIPAGADAVVPFEDVGARHAVPFLTAPIASGKNIRRAAEDVRKGTEVLSAGEKITSRTVALLAALGITTIPVFKRPKVRLIVTGSELAEPGEPLSRGKIYNSNGPALVAALREIGIEPKATGTVMDTEEDLRRALESSVDTDVLDVLITVGGVSAGDYDFVPKVLRDLGARILFHKVAMKPGKPLLYAMITGTHTDESPVWATNWTRQHNRAAGKVLSDCRLNHGPVSIFALPGNPVSSWTTFNRFVRPALLKMMGAPEAFRPQRAATVEEELQGSAGKEEYLRGIVTFREGRFFARSAGRQGSAHLLPLARANAILVIPTERGKIPAGETVMFEPIGEGG